MKKKFTITVTQAHIDAGIRVRSDICPVALAMRELKELENFNVGSCSFYYFSNGIYRSGRLPLAANYFINDFDAEPQRPVKPFSFEIEVEI